MPKGLCGKNQCERGGMPRLFVAVELDESCKRELSRAQRSLARYDRVVRWTLVEQMHLTLKFLGDTPDEQLADICDALHAACDISSPLEIELSGAGCFPPRGLVRVLWIGVGGTIETLRSLHRSIETRLERVGVAPDGRAYQPHLTLGRARGVDRDDGLRRAVQQLSVAPDRQMIESVALMESQLTGRGAVHRRIGHWPLVGSAEAPDVSNGASSAAKNAKH